MLEARIRGLMSAWPDALRGAPDPVHDARVASRRVREVLALIAADGGNGTVLKARRRLRRAGRVLGRVRELDAGLALLDELVAEHAELMGEVQAATGGLAEARRKKARAFGDLSGRFEAKLRKNLDAVLEELGGADALECRRALAAQIDQRRHRLLRAIRAAGVTYAPEHLHEARIALKRLRYSTELAAELSGQRANRVLGPLRRLQDILGRMHDLHVLERHLRHSDDASRFERLPDLLEAQIRVLHADYLARRDELQQAAFAALSTLNQHPAPRTKHRTQH
jgi:CHAD domain-containing protein